MGGYVVAGFHEVVVTPATRQVIERRTASGESLWRVSSTLFSHIQSAQLLQPIGQYANDESNTAYPTVLTGQQVL